MLVGPETFLPGSPAALECAEEPLADDWGPYPARDTWADAHLVSKAGLDHLRALAALLTADRVVYAPSTVARGALEAFASVRYRTHPDTDVTERVRRLMNFRLASDYNRRQLLQAMGANEPHQEVLDRATEKIKRTTDSGNRHGLPAHRLKDDRRPPYLGSPPLPSSTTMCDDAVMEVDGLGSLAYRLLCGVAHSQVHGLASHFIEPAALLDRTSGDVMAAIALTPRQAAVTLVAAPISAITASQSLLPPCGFNIAPLALASQRLVTTWARVGQMHTAC